MHLLWSHFTLRLHSARKINKANDFSAAQKKEGEIYMLNVKAHGIGRENFPTLLLWCWGLGGVSRQPLHSHTHLGRVENSLVRELGKVEFSYVWECGSTLTIKAQIMRINVCKKLFFVDAHALMHIFVVLCKSFFRFRRVSNDKLEL